MSEQTKAQERLTNVEERLTRLESLLVSINEKLEQRSDVGEVDTEKTEEFKQWVTGYVLNATATTRTRNVRPP